MAPKTSLFPPNRQKIKRAEEARKNQIKTMGDLEFTADMQPQFVGQMTQEQKDFIGGENPEKSKFREMFTYLDDPIAQYGFDPDRIRFQEPDKYQIQNAWSSKQQTTTDANAQYNPGYTKTGPNRSDIEKDIIKYGVKLGNSKEIIAHEARHRGFQLLRDMQLEGSEEDQKAWIKKYGREAAGLLDIYFSRDPRHKFSAETINEIRDRPDAKFNPPKFDAEGNPPNMGLFREGDRNAAIQFVPLEDLRESKKSGRIQFSGDFTDLGGNLRVSLSNEFINKAFQGLDKAAKDAMKKQKDDYRNKMTVRSQEGKRKFANGGSVEDQTGQAFKGLGYGEIIADNLIGLDNEYESLGEKIGKQFNQDEVAFLKTMGVGMAKGAYDVITNPDPLAYIKAAKEGFKEFATGTTNFLFKDLDTRLQEMFKTDYNNATPEQVTKARESVLGDAVIASGILPAGKVIGNVVEGAVDIGTNAARKIDLSKVNSAMARANEIAEDVEGKIQQSPVGTLERKLRYEQMGKGRGKQNSAQTAAALNLGYTEIGFHSTRRYNPNEEIEVFKLPDEVFADRAADKGITLQELLDNEGLTFNNKNNAHDFLGVHVGTTKAAADRFSDLSFEKGLPEMEGSRTYQLRLKTNKPFLDGKKPWTEKGLNTFLVKEMDKIKNGQVFEKMQIVRRRLAEQGYTHVPYINDVEDKRNISYAMLVDRPEGGGVNSSAVIRYKDAEFNPLEKSNRNAKFAQGGVAMKDQMEMSFAMDNAFDKGALILDLNNNNTNKNNTVKNYDPLEALTQEYNILREKEIKRIESGNLQKHDSGSVEDMDEYAYERQILDWLKSKSKDQPIGGYDANANSSIFSDLPSFWKAPHDYEHSTLGGLVDPNKYKSKFDTYREFFRKVPEEYLNNHPNSENLKFMQKVFKEMDRQEPMVARGGLIAMKDQMEMSFALGGVAETVDPVSGNDVPPGSLPEEVRDDIPARLSEGEYVVPADVVRYYGVKFFEDLRMQAKMGLQQMDADGRIGGEPMEPQQAELSDDDLNSIIEQAMQQEQPMMANEGGLAGYYNGSFVGGSLFGPQPSTEDGGDVFTAKDYKLELPKVAPITTAIAGPAYETKTFYKPDGTLVSVNFINGVPQQSIQGLSAKSPNEMDKVETYNPLEGAKLNALGQPVEEDGVTPIDMSRVGQFKPSAMLQLFGKDAQYERSLKENIGDPDKIKEQATQELEKSNNFFNGLGKIVLGIGGTMLAGPVAGFAAAEGFDKYVTGQNIADAKVSQMVLEKQFNVNPVEVSRKVEAYTELTAAESAWNTINKKVISQTGTTNLDKILNKIGFGPQLADIEARYAALSPAEQQNKADEIIAATDTSQSAARSAQEERLNTARTKWAGQPEGNPSWNQTGPTEETYKKYINVGRQSEKITANGQVMRTQADAFNQNRADDQSAASKRAGERAAYTASAAKRNQTEAEALAEFNASRADEIRTKYGGNKQTDSNGQDLGGTHCCTAAQARGDMTITEVKKLRAWHRQQDMFWQEGYDVWGKVIADNLVAKSKWQSDRVRDFYDHKIYGKRTIGSMYADVVIYPMSYIIGGYKVLKNTLKIKGINYGS